MKEIKLYTYEEWCKIKEEREDRSRYFFKQKMFAVGMFLFAILMIVTDNKMDLPGMSGIGLIVMLASVFLFFTKNMVITDDYFLSIDKEDRY